MKRLLAVVLLAVSTVVSAQSQPKPEDRGLPQIPVWAVPIVVPVKYDQSRGGVLVTATAPTITTDANGKNLGYSTVRLVGVVHF